VLGHYKISSRRCFIHFVINNSDDNRKNHFKIGNQTLARSTVNKQISSFSFRNKTTIRFSRFSEIAKHAPPTPARIQQQTHVIIPRTRQELFGNTKRSHTLSIAQRLKKVIIIENLPREKKRPKLIYMNSSEVLTIVWAVITMSIKCCRNDHVSFNDWALIIVDNKPAIRIYSADKMVSAFVSVDKAESVDVCVTNHKPKDELFNSRF